MQKLQGIINHEKTPHTLRVLSADVIFKMQKARTRQRGIIWEDSTEKSSTGESDSPRERLGSLDPRIICPICGKTMDMEMKLTDMVGAAWKCESGHLLFFDFNIDNFISDNWKKECLHDSNRNVYEDERVVRFYASKRILYAPEKRIMGIFKSKLKNMRMLDIGIGGGRTTRHFGPRVKEYVGIDYSHLMIEECKKEFAGNDRMFFYPCDARDMSIFDDNNFDLMLFSLNGIDLMSHNDRFKILGEVKRVGKDGSFFAFSSHNLSSLHTLFKHTAIINLANLISVRIGTQKFVSPEALATITAGDGYAMVRSREVGQEISVYYILPRKQIEQLQQTGYRVINVIISRSGMPIPRHKNVDSVTDDSLYYLAEVCKEIR